MKIYKAIKSSKHERAAQICSAVASSSSPGRLLMFFEAEDSLGFEHDSDACRIAREAYYAAAALDADKKLKYSEIAALAEALIRTGEFK